MPPISTCVAAAVVAGFALTVPVAQASAAPEPAPSSAARNAAPSADHRAAPSSPAARLSAAADKPKCWYGACFQYVNGTQYVSNAGASVITSVEAPEIDQADVNAHSLQELAVMTNDRAFIVEVGWSVDKGLNGDTAPHLFVYHWVNNTESCYNGCGFVSTSALVKPGTKLRAHSAAALAIRFSGGNWWISVDGIRIGYFPGSLWNNAYTRADEVEAFGEVSSTTTPTCSDMGDGRWGTRPGSSWFAGYRLYGSRTRANWKVSETSPSQYTYGRATGTSFRLGGPGSGPCTRSHP